MAVAASPEQEKAKMAKKIQIICTKPGMRRRGFEHPQTATYDLDRWSAEDLEAFRADPAFVVQEIDDAAVVTKGDEFEKAVAAEAKERVKAISDQLQGSFAKAVEDAVAEKTAAAEKHIAELEAQLTDAHAAAEKLKASLEAELAEAKAKLAEATAPKAGAKK
jgi:hypothetical protein